MERFRALAQKAQASQKQGGALTVHQAHEYDGMRLFLTQDGKAGFALDGDELVSLFSMKGGHQGLNATALQLAIQQGARRLADAFLKIQISTLRSTSHMSPAT